MNEATRFKLAIGLISLYFIQGIIKAFLREFPIEIVMGGEGIVAGYYFTVRTVNDVKAMKYNCTNGAPPTQ